MKAHKWVSHSKYVWTCTICGCHSRGIDQPTSNHLVDPDNGEDYFRECKESSVSKLLAYVNKDGVEFYEGDQVTFEKTMYSMHVDGWGRDLPGKGPESKEVAHCEGVVTFEKHRGEFVIVGEWPFRTNMYMAENLKHKEVKHGD